MLIFYNNMIKNEFFNLIWIDLNVNNDENKKYIEKIRNLKQFKIFTFQNIDDAFEKIKKIEFVNTFIIIQGNLYKEFINSFQSYENEMMIIPKIIIYFKGLKEEFENLNHDINTIYTNQFYNIIGMKNNFDEIIDYLKQSIKNNNIPKEIFEIENIDDIKKLFLPIYFKTLINLDNYYDFDKFISFLEKKYYNNDKLLNLVDQINSFKNIPKKLLCKYLIRIYMLETHLKKRINDNLLKGITDNYLDYIKIIFEGIKLNSLSSPTNENLYYATILTNEKICLLKENLKKKNNDLPNSIIFSKSFITFTKNKEYALNYFSDLKEIENEIPVLFNLEKYENVLNDDYFTHCDIEKLSINQDLKEVLFLPFSSFEITEIKNIDLNGKKITQINLNYIVKYELQLRKELNSINEDEIICSSNFKDKLYLIKKNEINSLTYKTLFQKVINYKNEIKCIYVIKDDKVGKKVQILNCFNEIKKKNAKLEDNYNEEELRENCELYINEKKIDFCFNYIFPKAGKYVLKIKCKKPLENVNCMFDNCSCLINIDFSKFNSYQIKNMNRMFFKCSSLNSINLSNFNTSYVYTMISLFSECKSLENLDLSNFQTNNVINMNNMFLNCESLINLNISSFNTINVYHMSYMFNNCKKLKSIVLNNFNTKNVEDMNHMFNLCESLDSLDLSNFETENVKTMNYMFGNCKSLTSLDLSKFNTRNLEESKYMFIYCTSLKSLDLSKFNSDNLKNMMGMFQYCSSLEEINLNKFTKNVTDMEFLFCGCSKLSKLNLSDFVTDNVTDMNSMFNGCHSLSDLNINNFHTYNVSNMESMFLECNSLKNLDLSNFNTEKVTNMSNMFKNCEQLISIKLSSFNTEKVNNMENMFYSCYSLKSLDLSNFNTINVENMDNMFYNCSSLSLLNLSTSFNTENVSKMSNMFKNCCSLENLNLSSFNTIKVISMEGMFENCSSLTYLDLLNFDTSNVINIKKMFMDCYNLKTLKINFTTKNITKMQKIFYNCSQLSNLDVSSFNTDNVEDMNGMFYNCSSVEKLNLTNFTTGKVIDMSEMFNNCKSLCEIDLCKFNTIKVKKMDEMFYNCYSLKSLDLSSFNTSNVNSMDNIFNKLDKNKIKVNDEKLLNELNKI